jgi:hypothetical protein
MEEEIKLVIILILTFCTYLKVRTTWRSHPNTNTTQKKKVEQTSIIDEDQDMSEIDAQRIENLVFPPTPARPKTEIPAQ